MHLVLFILFKRSNDLCRFPKYEKDTDKGRREDKQRESSGLSSSFCVIPYYSIGFREISNRKIISLPPGLPGRGVF
ncbi:hypothetical protein RRG08_034029 [Elysia crispata]|uniref:Uncharacterized protein n=1 Tax=Elysia crispata TaxID=231223 RepID=A0AAE0YRS3_9GAST|nr:hypothetical protein RRG08_034029 [Elysia crispata]